MGLLGCSCRLTGGRATKIRRGPSNTDRKMSVRITVLSQPSAQNLVAMGEIKQIEDRHKFFVVPLDCFRIHISPTLVASSSSAPAVGACVVDWAVATAAALWQLTDIGARGKTLQNEI